MDKGLACLVTAFYSAYSGVRVNIEDMSTLFSADCVVGDVKLDLGDI